MEIIGTLVGVLFGAMAAAGGSYVVQRAAHQREAAERLAAIRRDATVEYLAAVYEVFEQISEVHRLHRDGKMPAMESATALRSMPSKVAQAGLETLRLVADDAVAAAAADLWTHVRRSPSAIGADLSWDQHHEWREQYWVTRRGLIDAARVSSRQKALDWSTAGIG